MTVPAGVVPANNPNAPLPGIPPVTPPTPEVPPTVPVPPVATPVTIPVTPPAQPEVLAPTPVIQTQEPINTGVAFYDNAGSLMQSAGIDVRAVYKDIQDNEGITPEVRANMVSKMGESQTFMIEQGLATQRTSEATERTRVYDAVGSKENWDTIATWTNSENCPFTKEQTAAYNAMLGQGGEQATLAAQKIKEAYMTDPTTNLPAQGTLQGDAGVPPAGVLQPIARAEYLAAKKKAIRENDGVAVAALEQRATYTMQTKPELWRPVRAKY